jgi:hypothetical protein
MGPRPDRRSVAKPDRQSEPRHRSRGGNTGRRRARCRNRRCHGQCRRRCRNRRGGRPPHRNGCRERSGRFFRVFAPEALRHGLSAMHVREGEPDSRCPAGASLRATASATGLWVAASRLWFAASRLWFAASWLWFATSWLWSATRSATVRGVRTRSRSPALTSLRFRSRVKRGLSGEHAAPPLYSWNPFIRLFQLYPGGATDVAFLEHLIQRSELTPVYLIMRTYPLKALSRAFSTRSQKTRALTSLYSYVHPGNDLHNRNLGITLLIRTCEKIAFLSSPSLPRSVSIRGRKPGSRQSASEGKYWIPASAGMTEKGRQLIFSHVIPGCIQRRIEENFAILTMASVMAAQNWMIAAAQESTRRRAHGRPAHFLLICSRIFFNKTPVFGRFDPVRSLLRAILLSKQPTPDSHGRRESGTRGLAYVFSSAIQIEGQRRKVVVPCGVAQGQCNARDSELKKEIRIDRRHKRAFGQRP